MRVEHLWWGFWREGRRADDGMSIVVVIGGSRSSSSIVVDVSSGITAQTHANVCTKFAQALEPFAPDNITATYAAARVRVCVCVCATAYADVMRCSVC